MIPLKRQFLLVSLQVLDILVMLMSLGIGLLLAGILQGQNVSLWELLQIKLKLINVIALLVFIPVWHVIFSSMRLYQSRRLEEGRGEWKDIVKAVFIGTFALATVVVMFQRNRVNQDALLLFAVLTSVLTWGSRMLMRIGLGWVRQRQRNLRHLLLIGSNPRVHAFARHLLNKPQLGYRIVGYIDDITNGQVHRQPDLPLTLLGTLQNFEGALERYDIDEVVLSLPIRSYYEQINLIVSACELQGIQVHLLSDFFPLQLARAHPIEFDGMPILTLSSGTMAEWPASLKRAFDLVVASLLVALLSPFFLLMALLIKTLSPGGPIFFVQTRVGYNRRRFQMLKFRTMIPDAEQLQAELEAFNEAQGPVFKIKNDPRITPIGRFLRKTSLDELPQLFNVIKGDMSLVGPRPLPLRDVEKFQAPWLKRRFSVKPGITCLWQVNGRCDTSFDQWIKQDLFYIDHWSFGLDLKILAKTIPVVLRGTGAH